MHPTFVLVRRLGSPSARVFPLAALRYLDVVADPPSLSLMDVKGELHAYGLPSVAEALRIQRWAEARSLELTVSDPKK